MLVLKKTDGFTIIELITSIALIGILVPIFVAGMGNILDINERARNRAIVNSAAQSKIEELRSIGYNSIDVSAVEFTDELPQKLQIPGGATYTVTQPEPSLKQVAITIDYQDGGGTNTMHFSSIVSEIGINQ